MPKETNSGYMGGWMGGYMGDWMGAQDSDGIVGTPNLSGIPRLVRDLRIIKFVNSVSIIPNIRRNTFISKVVKR